MRSLPRKSRRGVALLIVIATLALVLTSVAGLARLAADVRAARRIDSWTRTADDLLAQAEHLAHGWLIDEADGVALPPDVRVPSVAVLREGGSLDGLFFEVCLTAWDQEGMVPFELATSGSPLRMTLPDEVRDRLDRVRPPGEEHLGLDQLAVDSTGPYPATPPGERTWFGSVEEPAPPARDGGPRDDGGPVDRGPEAVGAFVATHPAGRPAINVNTAPLALVESALRLLGRGGLERIAGARATGSRATVPSGTRDPREGLPGLVETSDAWAFRIEVQVGSVRRSWWSVFQRSAQEWSLVQRLPILL